MDVKEILNLLTPIVVEGPYIDDVEIRDGVVNFIGRFSCTDEEEPHDVSWSSLCSLSEDLEPLGLRTKNTWSDNDSYGGEIVEIENAENR